MDKKTENFIPRVSMCLAVLIVKFQQHKIAQKVHFTSSEASGGISLGLALKPFWKQFRSCFSIGRWYVGIVYPISHRTYPNSSGQKVELKLLLHFCNRQMHLSSTTQTTGKNYQKDLPKSVRACCACYCYFTAKKPLINFLFSAKETNVLWARKSNGMPTDVDYYKS